MFGVTEIVAVCSLLVSISSAIWARFKLILSLKKEVEDKIEKLGIEIKDIGTKINQYQLNLKDQCSGNMQLIATQMAAQDVRLSKQEMKMDLFWKMIEKEVSNILHQPIHYEKDKLLEKWPDLTLDEMKKLRSILIIEREELNDQLQAHELDEKKKAYLLGIALRLAHIEYILFDHGMHNCK